MITPEPVLPSLFLEATEIVTTLGRMACAAADTVPAAAGDVPPEPLSVLRSSPPEDTTAWPLSLLPATSAPTPPPTPAETSASASAAATSRRRCGGPDGPVVRVRFWYGPAGGAGGAWNGFPAPGSPPR